MMMMMMEVGTTMAEINRGQMIQTRNRKKKEKKKH